MERIQPHNTGSSLNLNIPFDALLMLFALVLIMLCLHANIKAHEAFAEYHDLLEELEGRLSTTATAEGR